jgi:hypothetical protein
MWYYDKDNNPVGPLALDEIKKLIISGEITKKTRVWQTGMKKWVQSEYTELIVFLDETSQPINYPKNEDKLQPQGLPLYSVSHNKFAKDPSNLTNILKISLICLVVIDVISLLSDISQINLIDNLLTGYYTTDSEFKVYSDISDKRQGIIVFCTFVIYTITAISFLMWIYRANSNLRNIGVKDLEFTPGWSIGWYFIPIAFLWKPYQAMKEIWQASKNPNNWKNEKGSLVLRWWWAFWLIDNFVGFFLETHPHKSSIRSITLENLQFTTRLSIFTTRLSILSDIVSIVAIILGYLLVKEIYDMQKTYIKRFQIQTRKRPITM